MIQFFIGCLILLAALVSCGKPMTTAEAKVHAPPTDNHEFKWENTGNNSHRYENNEVICYVFDDHGVSCNWK